GLRNRQVFMSLKPILEATAPQLVSACGNSASIPLPNEHISTAVCTSCAVPTSRSTVFLKIHFPVRCHGTKRGYGNCLSRFRTRCTGTASGSALAQYRIDGWTSLTKQAC